MHCCKRVKTAVENNAVKTRNKKLIFKNNAPFRSYMSKINNTLYNLLVYRDNYCITSGSLWNYYNDEINDAANQILKYLSNFWRSLDLSMINF